MFVSFQKTTFYPNTVAFCVIFFTSARTFQTPQVPPSLNSEKLQEAKALFIDEADFLLTVRPNFHLILCGDFNHFNVPNICAELDLNDVMT